MFDALFWLVPLVLVVVFLKLVLEYLDTSRAAKGSHEYRACRGLFSDSELAFLTSLRPIIPRTHTIMGKVRLADIIQPAVQYRGKNYIRAFNRISAKHVDFVLCDRDTYRIEAVIELDDSSHTHRRRQSRDAFLDVALTQANIPIIHFTAKASYDPSSIQEVLKPIISMAKNTAER